MAKSDESEDHHFYATIKTPPNEFEPAREFKRVLCRLWLPKRPVDRIRMEFYPTQEQANALPERLSPFALRGRKVELPGNTTTIRASQVWDHGVPMRSLRKNRMETVFEADPIDLQVFTTGRPERTKKRRVTAHINYFIAHSSRELSPAKIVNTWETERRMRKRSGSSLSR